MAAAMGPNCPTPVALQPQCRSGWKGGVALEHFGADLSGGDLAQRDHGGLVAVGLDQRRGARAKLARAVVAASMAEKRLGILFRQSSTVMRAMGFRSFLLDDRRQLLPGGIEVFVNYSVMELPGVLHFAAGGVQAAAGDQVCVLAARAHAPLQSSSMDGGGMKMPTHPGRCHVHRAPCQSISRIRSSPRATPR